MTIDPEFWNLKLGFKTRDEHMFNFIEQLKSSHDVFFVTHEGKEFWETQDGVLYPCLLTMSIRSPNLCSSICSLLYGVRMGVSNE